MLGFQRLKGHFTYRADCPYSLSISLCSSEEVESDGNENVTMREGTARTVMLMGWHLIDQMAEIFWNNDSFQESDSALAHWRCHSQDLVEEQSVTEFW